MDRELYYWVEASKVLIKKRSRCPGCPAASEPLVHRVAEKEREERISRVEEAAIARRLTITTITPTNQESENAGCGPTTEVRCSRRKRKGGHL
jgi:hypothetical protein